MTVLLSVKLRASFSSADTIRKDSSVKIERNHSGGIGEVVHARCF
jgi:hypothetical protein